MAILRVCAVHDSKAESFQQPVTVVALGVAHRGFADEMSENKHRADYILYHVADYNTADGSFSSIVPPKLVVSGADILPKEA